MFCRRAGADRGVRVPIVRSVRIGNEGCVDELVSFDELVSKRDYLRDHIRGLKKLPKTRTKKKCNYDEERDSYGGAGTTYYNADRTTGVLET